jgi:hypothetical protein
MQAKRTLVFAILFLTILAGGLVTAQAAPAGACDPQAQVQVALTPVAALAELQAAPVAVPLPSFASGRTGSGGLECVSFCSIALCPEGTTCGPSPGGGCGCNPNGGVIVVPHG